MKNTGAIPLAREENHQNHRNEDLSAHPEDNPQAWYLIAEGDWIAGQRFDIHDHAVLGRDADCDITIPGTHLSRHHAELIVKGPILQIRDLGSSNGTFVNNNRVSEAELYPGESIRFDVLSFTVCGPELSEQQSPSSTNVHLVSTSTSITQKDIPLAPKVTEKNWKTKPTSVGNREQTIQMTIGQKAAYSFWTLLAILTGVVTISAIGYMLTQL